MQPLTRELMQAMRQEKAVYESLLDLAIKKKEVLIQNDVDRLNEINGLEGENINKLEESNKSIKDIFERFAMHNGLDSIISLSTLSELLEDEKEIKALEELRLSIVDVVFSLSEMNGLNQRLLETHMQYTSFCLGVLTQEEMAGDIYGSTGYVNDGTMNRRGLIDQKV